MLQILTTKCQNAEELVDIIVAFKKAAKKYVAYGIISKYQKFTEEQTSMAREWNKKRKKMIRADMQRAHIAKGTLESDLVNYITNVVIAPDVAEVSRDRFFEELGVLQTLPHTCRVKNPYGESFDTALKALREAVRSKRFIQCVSPIHLHKHLQEELSLPTPMPRCMGAPLLTRPPLIAANGQR